MTKHFAIEYLKLSSIFTYDDRMRTTNLHMFSQGKNFGRLNLRGLLCLCNAANKPPQALLWKDSE